MNPRSLSGRAKSDHGNARHAAGAIVLRTIEEVTMRMLKAAVCALDCSLLESFFA